ncbi:MAG: 50S ribosomal protein L3 [Candidatus Zambryskibacteria bacterium]|nr:50S ribosomal protein L3 [Candidatus Zambryskibacteria bacterium]
MKFLLAKKVNMTQIFGEDNRVTPVTVLNVEPNVVSFIKTNEKDGYNAVQVAFGYRKENKISKPLKGHLGELKPAVLKEFRVENIEFKKNEKILADIFEIGDTVAVSAISKAKGFQGVVKRHGFHGGPRTHGQKHSEREPGSIGVGGVQRVLKGTRMAGRMGGKRITVKNLKVVGIDMENNNLLVSGAIPGRRGTLVEVKNVSNETRNSKS